MPLPIIAGLAAAGLVKGLLDQKREQADRRQSAEMARWSPWTGMRPNEISKSDVLGSTMQGGMTGAMMSQSMGAQPAAAAPAAPAGTYAGGMSQMAQPGSQQALAQKYPWLAMGSR